LGFEHRKINIEYFKSTSPHSLILSQKTKMITMKLEFKARRVDNSPGNLFVDESCIDCDVCRWMAPEFFGRVGLKSIVTKQPDDSVSKLKAYQAMCSCPVGAIRLEKPDTLVKEALSMFPVAVDVQHLPGIYYLGHTDKNTAGATSYLLIRPNGLNVMVDVPRFNERLAKLIENAGGITYLLITHKDDAGDHLRWKARFPNLVRFVNRLDVLRNMRSFEEKLEDDGPWYFDDAGDHSIVWTPGHTYGSVVLTYKPPQLNGTEPEVACFTGDHLAWSSRLQALTGYYRYNKAGINRQIKALEKMKGLDFQWVLPAHGPNFRFQDKISRDKRIDDCIGMMNKGPQTLVEVAN